MSLAPMAPAGEKRPVTPIERLAEAALTRADVEAIVAAWTDRLQLRHWRIEVQWDDPLDPDLGMAETKPHGEYDYAKIRFAADFETWDRWTANTCVVHELVHLHGRDLEAAIDSVKPLLAATAYTLFQDRADFETEAFVDKTAGLLVALGGEV